MIFLKFFRIYSKHFDRRDENFVHNPKVDVIIPVIDKDFEILPLCINSLKKYCLNKIDKIYVVSNSKKIREYCINNNLQFVEENNIIPKNIQDKQILNKNGEDRSGWLKQQLIKLSGEIGENRFYLVIDADHVLLKEHIFLTSDKKTVFYVSEEYNEPYYDFLNKIWGEKKINNFSYVSHKMLFDKKVLKELKIEIEQKFSESWIDIILNNLKTESGSFFSEYELYGNFLSSNRKIIKPWNNKNIFRRDKNKCDLYQVARRYSTVTFPSYLK